MGKTFTIRTTPKQKLLAGLAKDFARYPDGDPSLWSVQKKALRGLDNVIRSDDGNNFFLEMFTATGKTRTFIKIIDLMSGPDLPPRTIIVVPTRFMLKQVQAELAKFSPHLSDHVGLYYTDVKEPNKRVVVTTYNSFVKATAEGVFSPKKTELLVIDEAHEGISEARLQARDQYADAVKLGLSATPDYSSDRTVANHYKLAYKLTHEEAIKERVISPFRNILLMSEVDLDQVPLEMKDEYNAIELEKAVNIRNRNLAAVELYKTYRDPETSKPFLGQKAIFNCTGIKHAQDFAKFGNDSLADVMPEGKIFCEAIWGDMPEKQKDAILERHRTGKTLALAQVDLLIRGHNDPAINLCFNLAPSMSSVVVGQRGGRVERNDPANPGKIAYIIDVVDQSVNPAKMPLLYGEYVNGSHFGTVPECEEKGIEPWDLLWKRQLPENLDILVTQEEIMAFFAERKQMREDMLRKGIICDKVLPSIREHMDRLGIETTRQLYDRIEPDLMQEENATSKSKVRNRFERVVRGLITAWDRFTGEVNPAALLLSELFETRIENLFGFPPEISWTHSVTERPANPELFSQFNNAMKDAGFPTLTSLRNALVLSPGKVSLQSVRSIARGEIYPFSPETGDWSPLASEIATLLNSKPENLFGFDPLHQDTHEWRPSWVKDQWEEDDPWYDAQAEEDGPRAVEPLTLSFMGRRKSDWQQADLLVEPAPAAEDVAMERQMHRHLREAFRGLSAEEGAILALRYNIDGVDISVQREDECFNSSDAPAYAKIADAMGLPLHTTRRIEGQAIDKLRSSEAGKKLRVHFKGQITLPEPEENLPFLCMNDLMNGPPFKPAHLAEMLHNTAVVATVSDEGKAMLHRNIEGWYNRAQPISGKAGRSGLVKFDRHDMIKIVDAFHTLRVAQIYKKPDSQFLNELRERLLGAEASFNDCQRSDLARKLKDFHVDMPYRWHEMQYIWRYY